MAQQWRLNASLTDSPYCKLCCGLPDYQPQAGTLLHRVATCPATKDCREAAAPANIKDVARRLALGDVLPDWQTLLCTRALGARLPPCVLDDSQTDTLVWHVKPGSIACGSFVFTDGSLIDTQYFHCCERLGWAFVVQAEWFWHLRREFHLVGWTPSKGQSSGHC